MEAGKYRADGQKPFDAINKNMSKKISKVDEASKQLIMDVLGEKQTKGFDIDSIYYTKNGWIVLEFLKCDSYSPYKSHPNRYWKRAFRKVISLWELTKKLEGRLFWITYEVPYKRFSIIEFLEIDLKYGVTVEKRIDTDFDGFKDWFHKLNDSAEPLW